ncbi:MAG: F0F1 ATP synthase subunit A [Hyphomicrobiaceae bacterium]
MASGTGNDAAAHGPLEQFEIKRLVPLELFGYDISFTNSSLWMMLTLGGACAFLYYAMRGGGLIPTRLQSAAEMIYEFIEKTVTDICGPEAKKFFPFIFTLFTFILAANTLGLLPGSFTVTSHLSVTLALALLVFTIVTVVGFARNGLGYLKMFAPEGVPILLMPLIVVIEVISYFMRPISLSVRLFANMIAGHILLKVFAGFVVGLGVLGGWAPLAFMIGFTGFELLVAALQAFIFALLTCIYLNDALNMHH